MNILEGRAGYVVLMDRISVTISYSFCCLTTETVKYTNENSFIENLAASKYCMWAQIGKQMYILHFQKRNCPVYKNVNRFVSVNCSVQRKRSKKQK